MSLNRDAFLYHCRKDLVPQTLSLLGTAVLSEQSVITTYSRTSQIDIAFS